MAFIFAIGRTFISGGERIKRIWIFSAIMIMGITSFSLFNIFSQTDSAYLNEDELNEQEQIYNTLNIITEKIHENYKKLKFVVSYNSQKELKIHVNEKEEIFNTVNEEITSIAKREIKSSTLKDYIVVVERMDFSFISEEQKTLNNVLLNLTHTLWKVLREDYEIVEELYIHYQKSITIHTSIKSSDKDAHQLAETMEKTINEILHLNEFKAVESYEIYILDNKGKVIN